MVLPPFALARNALGSKTDLRSRFIAELLGQRALKKRGKMCRPTARSAADRSVLRPFLQKSRIIADRSGFGPLGRHSPELAQSLLNRPALTSPPSAATCRALAYPWSGPAFFSKQPSFVGLGNHIRWVA